MAKRPPIAAVSLKGPEAPITRTMAADAVSPILDLLGIGSCLGEDVLSIQITPTSIVLRAIPRSRGRRQLNSTIRVTYPIVFDLEDQ